MLSCSCFGTDKLSLPLVVSCLSSACVSVPSFMEEFHLSTTCPTSSPLLHPFPTSFPLLSPFCLSPAFFRLPLYLYMSLFSPPVVSWQAAVVSWRATFSRRGILCPVDCWPAWAHAQPGEQVTENDQAQWDARKTRIAGSAWLQGCARRCGRARWPMGWQPWQLLHC